jgi:putative redox protein
MVETNIAYEGKLHCSALHLQSGAKIATDAPKDNHGLGQSFSPTDLLATALGTCMMTIMGIVSSKQNIDLTGTTIRVLKEMTPQPPRRVAKLTVELAIPQHVPADKRPALENAAHTCPVRLSIHPNIEVPVTFKWGL